MEKLKNYLQQGAPVLPFHLVLVYAFVEQLLIHVHEQLQGIVDQPLDKEREIVRVDRVDASRLDFYQGFRHTSQKQT